MPVVRKLTAKEVREKEAKEKKAAELAAEKAEKAAEKAAKAEEKAAKDAEKQRRAKMTPEERAHEIRLDKTRKRIADAKAKKADQEKNMHLYRAMAERAFAGTGEFDSTNPENKKKAGQTPGANLMIKMPMPIDRLNTRTLMLGGYRVSYGKLGKHKGTVDCPSAGAPDTTSYSQTETSGLTIKGGHQSLPRPRGVSLPVDHMKKVGSMSLKELNEYHCENTSNRYLLSVYGDIFDVSDRPDKYGPNGPYHFMSGRDLTWGFVSGRDGEEHVDKLYDLWKVAPESLRDAKLKLIYAWVGWYEYEYDDSVGKLTEYEQEGALKGPPIEDSEDCCIM